MGQINFKMSMSFLEAYLPGFFSYLQDEIVTLLKIDYGVFILKPIHLVAKISFNMKPGYIERYDVIVRWCRPH